MKLEKKLEELVQNGADVEIIQEFLSNIKQELEERLKELNDTRVFVSLFGQPGSGKSSIINVLVGKNVCEVGVTTDTTKEAQIVDYNESLVFVDLPGYGTSKFPLNAFTQKFDPKDYDLFLCVFESKLHEDDVNFFKELSSSNKPVIFVRNKVDSLWDPNRSIEELKNDIRKDLEEKVGSTYELVFVSARDRTGIDELEKMLVAKLEDAKHAKMIMNLKAYSQDFLDQKRRVALSIVEDYAWWAALNGLNPIPGLDVAVDMGIVGKMFSDILELYNLDEDSLKYIAATYTLGAQIVKEIAEQATRRGMEKMLEILAKRIAKKLLLKWIPILGQAASVYIGYKIVETAGRNYVEKCHELANMILESELGIKQ